MFRARRAWMVGGAVAIVLGALWALQGGGIVPGSVMSGDPTWLVIGSITAVAGAIVVLLAARAPR